MLVTASMGLLVLLFAQPPQTDAYREIVALQNRALQASRRLPDIAQDHRRSITLAQTLNRPALVAVLFQRLGRHLEATDVQQAVIAYEAALSALAGAAGFDVDRELDRLKSVPKGFTGRMTAVPADLYSQPLASALDAAQADPQIVVHLLLDIGNAYFQQPQLEPALDRYRAALARPEIGGAPALRAYALANIAEIDRQQGRIADAEQKLREALSLFDRQAASVDARRALVVLAGLQRDRGEREQAFQTYTQALALYARVDDPRGEGRAYSAVGRLHLDAGRISEARTAFSRAIDRGTKIDDSRSLWYAHWGLGQVQQRSGEIDAAAVSLRKSLDLIEKNQRGLNTDEGKVTFLDSAQQVFDQLVDLHLTRTASNRAAYGDALEIAERARAGAMRDMMEGRSRSGLLCPPRQGEQRAPAAMSPISQMAPGTGSLAPTGPPDPRCAEGRNRRPATTPLTRLVFHVLADRTAVFAVTGSDVRGHVVPIGRDAIVDRVTAFRVALGVDGAGRGVTPATATVAPSPTAYRDHARSLYRDLIAPVANALRLGDPVAIEPHGALWLVPFAALEDENGVALAERWPIVYAPSADVLNEIRREPAFDLSRDLNALIVGNPLPPAAAADTDDRFRSAALRVTFEPLPGAEAEANAIADLLPRDRRLVLTGAQADLATIESRVPEHTLVHIASHALAIADGPLDSFVMLAPSAGTDGRLSARRVLNLPMSADLVTLSACQTGLGYLSGDGVIGLSRAFLVRGARSVLVSQWSVSDTATAALMEGFYRRYLSSGGDKVRALQQAMREVRTMKGFEHPRYWAPFVLIGAER
jgi:CHAT domain-containing protein/tetratricopeptide (TPR) repeat protein